MSEKVLDFKKLLDTQKMVINLKTAEVAQALQIYRERTSELGGLFQLIKKELGIPEEEANQWSYNSEKFQFEKLEISPDPGEDPGKDQEEIPGKDQEEDPKKGEKKPPAKGKKGPKNSPGKNQKSSSKTVH